MKQSREPGQASPTIVGAVALIALIASVGVWTSTRGDDDPGSNNGSPGPTGSASASVDPGSGDDGDDGDDDGRCDHTAARPASLECLSAGSKRPMSIAISATTTSNSISVNACWRR